MKEDFSNHFIDDENLVVVNQRREAFLQMRSTDRGLFHGNWDLVGDTSNRTRPCVPLSSGAIMTARELWGTVLY